MGLHASLGAPVITGSHRSIVLAALASVFILLPMLALWWLNAGPVGISASRARVLIDEQRAMVVAVHREPEDELPFVASSKRWLLSDILNVKSKEGLPNELRTSPLILVCSGGIQSALAARHLRGLGLSDVYSLVGGQGEWIASGGGCPIRELIRGDAATDQKRPRYRRSTKWAEGAALGAFFGIKTLYTVLAMSLWYVMRRQQTQSERSLARGMGCFVLGEACCFANVMFAFDRSMWLEHAHSVGMVFALAFVSHAALSSRWVAAVPTPIVRRALLALAPVAVTLCCLPLAAPLRLEAYSTRIFGVLHGYHHAAVHQSYELRYLPVVAMVLLLAGGVAMATKEGRSLAWGLLSFALGALGFSWFRMVLVAVFIDELLWFSVWEELLEFVSILAVLVGLSKFARLFPRAHAEVLKKESVS